MPLFRLKHCILTARLVDGEQQEDRNRCKADCVWRHHEAQWDSGESGVAAIILQVFRVGEIGGSGEDEGEVVIIVFACRIFSVYIIERLVESSGRLYLSVIHKCLTKLLSIYFGRNCKVKMRSGKHGSIGESSARRLRHRTRHPAPFTSTFQQHGELCSR